MLVSCVVYQDGKKLAEIATREIHEYLSRPNCFVWVALRDPQAPEQQQPQGPPADALAANNSKRVPSIEL